MKKLLVINFLIKKYLLEQLENHNFESIIQSKDGENVYLIAEERDVERIYIAFRGTQDLVDWKRNIKANLVPSDSSLIPGKLHAGFLQRANLFPYEKILYDEAFKEKEVVVCGHSLGGAIASIVAIRLQTERARLNFGGKISCITFGAPLFGEKVLQESLNHQNMHHFVCNNDPVPYLLNYVLTASSLIGKLNSQIVSLNQKYSTNHGKQYLAEKNNYEKIVEATISGAGIFASIAAHVYPAARVVKDATAVFSIYNDIKEAYLTGENVYTPIGNFYFLDEQSKNLKSFDWECWNDTAFHVEEYFNNSSDKIAPSSHSLTHYHLLFKKHARQCGISFQSFYSYIEENMGEFVFKTKRDVSFVNLFQPEVYNVEMIKVENRDKTILRLSFTGQNLFDLVLSSSRFSFNIPFAVSEKTTTIKKTSVGDRIQRVVIEEPYVEDVIIPEHGNHLIFATQFGRCEKKILPSNCRNLVNLTVAQIAWNDSFTLLLRSAMQRGMMLSNMMIESGDSSPNLLLEEIKQLGKIGVEPTYLEDVFKTLEENRNDFGFILSNEEAFTKFKSFCEEIEKYVRSPIEIEAEWSILQKVIFSASICVGAATVGSLLGPGLVTMGFMSACASASASVVGLGGLTGAGTFGVSAYSLMSTNLTDGAYENALKWINQQLLGSRQVDLDIETSVKIIDLQDEGSVYSNEKVLMMLTDTKYGELFPVTSSFYKLAARSKLAIEQRIGAIKRVHRIRKIFSQQCFLGIVGTQDAGKTTLLQKIWGRGGKTGFFSHTDTPVLHNVTSKFFVVDFPGSNSLDYHSKTFSICGPMNNMVIVVVPFVGDISSLLSDEIRNIFTVMKGSVSTRVLLCINKCGIYLEQLKEELKDKESPIDFMKNRFIDKLNEYYEKNEVGIKIRNEDVLFTDWMIGEEKHAREFGIVGPSEVKHQIRDYLVSYGIYEENESELDRCLISPGRQ